MAYAFNHHLSSEIEKQETSGNSGGNCSPKKCIGYAWRELKPLMLDGTKEKWHGADSIPWHECQDYAPPFSRWFKRLTSSATGYYKGTETGHNEYLFVKRKERIQWTLDRETGEFQKYGIPGSDIKYGRAVGVPEMSRWMSSGIRHPRSSNTPRQPNTR